MDASWEEFGWERLGNGVGRRRLPGWDATVALVVGADGVLLFDTGSTLREGAEVRAQVQALTGRRVTHIALSHPHFDHVLGTAAFSGVEVYGAVGVTDLLARGADELRADAVRHGVPEEDAAQAADVLVAPHHQVCDEWTLDLGGGRQVLLANVGPGHSGHDLAALVPGSPAVMLCGDLVEESGEPQAGPDAIPSRWPAALDRLLALGGEDAVYVPGHGALVDASFVRAQRDQLSTAFGVS
ncbi:MULTISPECIES: MBL fold metallo-hydrolase [unclassified Streptomyces]|uniref:MBL fold metallo-hydrolase n=1 Tax=unclassified Streptomyces TaxID=2593676 RepID=UPI002DDB1085|nr:MULTISPECIES: MBL fold metallo-hydrolase [unclassified Streptomyces]WSF86830.1 MBL fold metallo-hydrolase [Streptomyces sp. NBC_01744]WSC36900.1 MBL fold metallo-hydrolase [Streptomyces sp. NBC_01763]WSC45028.1 MBL fold metallo-hydrolase [Streptomyces sp. NBC_01762]WSC56000.1 MBL fold metallo-hydrolase [Streptomyces sp. NBC_01761]WSD24688.1 MBL fold metallo-hydrolase [Streptomyces sp. NBC_01751]